MILIPSTSAYPAMTECRACKRIVACDSVGRPYNHYLRGLPVMICPGVGHA